MSWWSIDPLDPLMVRDGRPFSAGASDARSLDFPPPSVTAGALRTRIGFAAREPTAAPFALTPDQARAIEVVGPVLAARAGDRLVLHLPAPRDAVLFSSEEGTAVRHGWPRHRLAPADAWPAGAHSLPEGLLPVEPVGEMPRAKPERSAPPFWTGAELEAWLREPAAADHLAPERTGPAIVHERRIHLAVDPATGTASDGMLFSTDGLRLDGRVLLVRAEDGRLVPGAQTVGGERRLSLLRAEPSVPTWPAPPLSGGRARVVLLTPALFREGAVPTTLLGARVRAAAVGRPQVVSGWDLAAGGPKPARRMAPAGSVYWVDVPNDVAGWLERAHWGCVSDDEQDRRDGFGLAVVGVWS